MPVNSSHASDGLILYYCLDSTIPLIISIGHYVVKSAAGLPLFILVFHHAALQRQQRRPASHCDIFTFHLIAIEGLALVTFSLFLLGVYTDCQLMAVVGFQIVDLVIPAEMYFHALTCAERYLAVVHPITYRRLKQSYAATVRNVSNGSAWLLCCAWKVITIPCAPDLPIIPFTCCLLLTLFVVSYCSLGVLCVLVRPVPGDALTRHTSQRVSPSNRRALHTVMAILATLWLWFVGLLVCLALNASKLLGHNRGCVAFAAGYLCALPSNLVLPLLFLQRVGKPICGKRSSIK